MSDRLERAFRATSHAPARAKLTESAFQSQVIALARMLGWKVAAFRPAMNQRGEWRTPVQGDGKGWPDLVLVKGDRILFRELKRDKTYLEPDQKAWRDALLAAGANWALWRPKDWPIIEATLKGEEE